MKLLDKLKNALFEEEYVEVEEEPKKVKKKEKPKEKEVHKEIKKEVPIAKKIELPERDLREDRFEEEVAVEEEADVRDSDLLRGDPNFKFPVILEDDFSYKEDKPVLSKTSEKAYNGSSTYGMREEESRTEKEDKSLYSNSLYTAAKQDYTFHDYNPYEKKEKRSFTPSPVISPIYGVLDYNYKKEEVVTKKEKPISSYGSKNMDLDAVREKAYGTLENEMGLSMSDEEREEDFPIDEADFEDSLLVDMRDTDTTPAVTKVTVGDAEEYFQDLGLEYNIDYKDVSKERVTGRRVNRTRDLDEDDGEEESEDKKLEKAMDEDTDSNLEDNLFDLIDSMYEEKEDED